MLQRKLRGQLCHVRRWVRKMRDLLLQLLFRIRQMQTEAWDGRVLQLPGRTVHEWQLQLPIQWRGWWRLLLRLRWIHGKLPTTRSQLLYLRQYLHVRQ